jgi:hypothetical protein
MELRQPAGLFVATTSNHNFTLFPLNFIEAKQWRTAEQRWIYAYRSGDADV